MKPFLTCTFLILTFFVFSQDKEYTSYIDMNNFKGNIALHNNDILHLINGHPAGVVLSWNKKTYGFNDWEQRYNYPDYGFTFVYQNLENEVLGGNASLYAHYNFYFFNRNVMFRIGQGIGYAPNPYDKEENYRNIAFGSHLLSSTMMMLNYKKERIIDRFGVQAGFSFIHYSNANIKAPNASVNTIAFNLGVTYNLDENEPDYITTIADGEKEKFTQPIKYNVAFRGGVNESDVVGSGQFPFYIFSAYADKRINVKSALQLGTDVFFSNFLKEYIYYKSVSFPEENVSGDEDFKRVGVFVGHELFINRTSLETQLGYYVYYPFDFEGRVYSRIGLKRYVNDKWFGALTLKTHGAKAEAVELGIGVRL
ncbi:acyloxyacyl hydrolase [Mariniflexile soesokkakense]|uniref:Acyloxyacyl hydrolase n=1 Tax=Mariniflexile soesokkakense TaxID=1343160 RepID=A0ABV0AC21_9FLAO